MVFSSSRVSHCVWNRYWIEWEWELECASSSHQNRDQMLRQGSSTVHKNLNIWMHPIRAAIILLIFRRSKNMMIGDQFLFLYFYSKVNVQFFLPHDKLNLVHHSFTVVNALEEMKFKKKQTGNFSLFLFECLRKECSQFNKWISCTFSQAMFHVIFFFHFEKKLLWSFF